MHHLKLMQTECFSQDNHKVMPMNPVLEECENIPVHK